MAATYIHKVTYLRISPQKLRLVGRAIKGKTVADADAFLAVQHQKGARALRKAIAAGVHNAAAVGHKTDNFIIGSVATQKGPTFMRRFIRAKGRATPKIKPTAHANIIFIQRSLNENHGS